nr:ATP/GTP-binding protein [Actinoplanes globisporus]
MSEVIEAGPSPSSPAENIISAKVIIAGGMDSSKADFVNAISELGSLTAETEPKDGDLSSNRPVLMDFGRISVADDLILYLFGTPGQTRLWFMWDELFRGAIGTVVLVDTQRLAESLDAVRFLEHRGLAYVIAAEAPDFTVRVDPQAVRDALAIAPDVPVLSVNPRRRESVKAAIVALVDYATHRLRRGERPA